MNRKIDKRKVNNGTREWAVKTVNCCTGCSHDCVYCYAKEMSHRFGQVADGQWASERIRQHRCHSKAPEVPRPSDVS